MHHAQEDPDMPQALSDPCEHQEYVIHAANLQSRSMHLRNIDILGPHSSSPGSL